ncbi:MAG: HlyC/CorC family transporter [Bacillaceae bacterium]|nr:HlyC/CorC family transporter [Bacillaceae bacterium]
MLIVVLLIILTAFFVASEFAIVKVRRSQLEARANEGNKSAELALKITGKLDDYLSACQLGITVTALGLGWLGEPTVDRLLYPIFAMFDLPEAMTHSISFVIAFSIVTFLHVVLGELAPKTIAIQKAEEITLIVAKPLYWFHRIMYPFIWSLNGAGNLVVRLFGFKTVSEQEEAHSEEELRYILSQSYKKGEINQSEYQYVDRIFEFDNRTAKEIMIPRTDMSVIDINDPVQEILKQIKDERYTRYPVVDEDKDHIIGMIHIKELFYEDCSNLESLRPFVRPIIKVFENIPIHDLLLKLQKDRTHLAVLIDEYGGTSGLVTVEDILEEIVGEIRDEFDHEEELLYKKIEENHYIVQGKIPIQDINELLETELDDFEIDTLSGWIFTQNIEAKKGTVITYNGYTFKVLEQEEGYIKKVEVKKG